jgi:hypothetical protein
MRTLTVLAMLACAALSPNASFAAKRHHRSAAECRLLVDKQMPHGSTTERSAARARCRAGKPI